LSINGTWSITAIVRKIGEFQWQATTQAAIASEAAAPNDSDRAQPWHFDDWAIAGLILFVLGSIAVGYRVTAGHRRQHDRPGNEPAV
jgi:hypothetical protein